MRDEKLLNLNLNLNFETEFSLNIFTKIFKTSIFGLKLNFELQERQVSSKTIEVKKGIFDQLLYHRHLEFFCKNSNGIVFRGQKSIRNDISLNPPSISHGIYFSYTCSYTTWRNVILGLCDLP
jgi:hypothetical protein